MERRVARNVADRIIAILAMHAPNDPLLKDFTFSDTGGTIGASLQMKLTVAPKVMKPFTGEVTQEDVNLGYAPSGTPITYRSKDGPKKAVILSTRRIRYLIQDLSDGKSYTLLFTSARLDSSRMTAAVAG